ncbi:hypothetical protein LTR48_006477 [Friedmanniomyces endolithicus]|uniref:FAM192A/Fyv6 N-terminal domain-containing protein n=1 Tax=Rachicladosporium monterosium TaxID=1507873 RepID=A0ABR0LEV3_9PEZI|nr:hypothetical protein LTR48_006477 [Friedmanniomyces endolithicus]KAK5147783.1 hypothetical protein LTR32_000802 [Rachicladosporium monterosium]
MYPVQRGWPRVQGAREEWPLRHVRRIEHPRAESLVEKMAEAQGEKQAAHAEMLKAQERFHSAFAEEARFRKQMDMNPRYADEAIAVEEREIVRSDSKEQAELGPPSFESFP